MNLHRAASGIARLLAFLLLAGGLLLPRPAGAQDAAKRLSAMTRTLREVQENLQVHEGRVAVLAGKYAAPGAGSLPSVYRLQTRINDGLVFFQLGDYERASILLMEVVQEQANLTYPGYKDALFYLAESLYQLKNPIAANQFYQVVVEKGYKQYRKDALLRLVEICFLTRRLEDVDRYFGLLATEPGVADDPTVQYVRAKSQYFKDDLANARLGFEQIRSGTPYYHRARYFLGTILVLQGQLDAALTSFQQVIAEAGTTPDAVEVKELSHLALGRLLFEQGQYADAAREYESLTRNSPLFQLARYEAGWAFIRKGDHASALRSLDILLLAAPDSTLAPEATLLKGNLQLRLGKFLEAQTTFQEIVDRFGPVREQLEEVLQEHADPDAFFRQLVGKNLDRFDVQVLVPPLATTWVREERQVGEALQVVTTIEAAAADITASEELIVQLEAALAVENRIEIFPELHSAWNTMLEIENNLLLLKKKLTDGEKGLIWGSATPEEQQRYQQLAGQRVGYDTQLREIPLTAQDLAQREATVEEAIGQLDMRAYRYGIEIESIKAQLVAMDKWITDTAGRPGQRKGSEARVRAAIVEQQGELQTLEGELAEVRRLISRQKVGVGVGDPVTSREAEIKRQYAQTLRDESQLLREVGRRLGPEAQQLLAQAESLRQRAGKAEETIHHFYTVVRRTVDEKVRLFREQVAEEKAQLARYRRQAEGFQGMGETMAGTVAADSFQTVQTKFRSLVLQADVGIIDVAWQRKEEKTTQSQALIRDKKVELDGLEAEFGPVLEEKL